MADVMDYLGWRGDLTFEADPFNEVDNMIMAELAYVKFDGIVPYAWDGGTIGIREARDLYFAKHTPEEEQHTFTWRAPLLLNAAAETRRYADMRIGGLLGIFSEKHEEQMSVVVFEPGDGSTCVAFRGTDNTIVGWKEDFNLSFMSETGGQRDAVRYLNRCFAGGNRKIRVCGHSKGGNLAVYAAAFCDPSVQAQIVSVYTHDGPGFREGIAARPEFQAILPRVVKIIPESSVIGTLLGSYETRYVVCSSASGIMQHDALTWQVYGNHFVRAKEQSALSTYLEKVMDDWIAGFDDEERRSFVDSLFGVISQGGFDTLADMQEDKWKTVLEIVRGMSMLPADRRREMGQIFGALLRSGGQGIGDMWNNGVRELSRMLLGSAPQEASLPEESPETDAEEESSETAAMEESPETAAEEAPEEAAEEASGEDKDEG